MNKITRYFYTYFMPAVVVLLLLGISPFVSSPKNGLLSFARIHLCIWFCLLYIRLSKISSYSHYPNIHWTKDDVGKNEKYLLIFLSIWLGVGSAIITFWAFRTLLVQQYLVSVIISILNGLIIMLPVARHYWVLKL